jgi:hypothetical protein
MVIVAVLLGLGMVIYFVDIITDSIKWTFPKKFPEELTGDKEFDRQQKMFGNAMMLFLVIPAFIFGLIFLYVQFKF